MLFAGAEFPHSFFFADRLGSSNCELLIKLAKKKTDLNNLDTVVWWSRKNTPWKYERNHLKSLKCYPLSTSLVPGPVASQVLAMDTLCEQEPDRFQDLLVRLSRRTGSPGGILLVVSDIGDSQDTSGGVHPTRGNFMSWRQGNQFRDQNGKLHLFIECSWK